MLLRKEEEGVRTSSNLDQQLCCGLKLRQFLPKWLFRRAESSIPHTNKEQTPPASEKLVSQGSLLACHLVSRHLWIMVLDRDSVFSPNSFWGFLEWHDCQIRAVKKSQNHDQTREQRTKAEPRLTETQNPFQVANLVPSWAFSCG